MFKKIISLSLIALMLFSCFSMVNAATLTVHARTQDNDGDYGIIRFFDGKDNLLGEHWISKGDTRTFDLSGVDYVDFRSVDRKNCYNADLYNLNRWQNDNKDQELNIYVDVNFYKKRCYENNFYIDKRVFTSNSNFHNPFTLSFLEVYYSGQFQRFNGMT